MKKGQKIRWFTLVIAVVFAIILVNDNVNKLLFARGTDERIVFAYGKAIAEYQEISIFVNEEKATLLEITSPTLEVSKHSVNTEMNYKIDTNGVYTFRLLDKDENEIIKVEQDFSKLKKLDIIENEEGWKIISRATNVKQVEASCGEATEIITLINDGNGNMFAPMSIPGANTCRFTPLDSTGTPIDEVLEYTKKSEARQDDTIVPLKKQITTAKDLHLISEQPDGIYELTTDINMSGMKTLDVIFSGTLEGNGYQMFNLQEPLFLKMDQAQINNVHLQGEIESENSTAALALQGNDSVIKGSSFQGAITSEKSAAGFLIGGEHVSFENSYVSAKIEAKTIGAGFLASGSGEVKESYITGVLKGDEVYGLGQDIEGKTSYIAANIIGKKRLMFNEEEPINDCFYDASLNDFEETRATAFSNTEMLSSDLNIEEAFFVAEGSYPQIKKEITDTWSEKSKSSADLSVFALALQAHENMATLEKSLTLPTTIEEQKIEWNNDGKVETDIISSYDEHTTVEETILMAKTEEGTRYFAMSNAQLLATNDIQVGERAPTATTTISFNATDGYYYKVAKADEVVNEVSTHKDAIEAGFKKRVGTGVYNAANIEWNTKYKVYETDLTTMTAREVTTNYGMLGGSMQVAGIAKVGEQLQASVHDTTTSSGTWTWYKSKSIDTGWTAIAGGTNDSLELTTDELGYYIKTVFTADPATNIQDEIVYIQDVIVKRDLGADSKISISGNAEIGAKLEVIFEGGLDKNDFYIQWYQKSTSSEDVKIGSGLQHEAVAKDVGKQIYAVATAKAESNYIGSITSDATSIIISLAMQTPTERPMAVSGTIEDTTVTMKMPDTVKDGLYRFGYQEAGQDIVEFPITVRGNNALTITGLTPGTTYQFKAKRIGENGYLDSAWGTRGTNISMGDQYITGYLDLRGNAVYGETLQVEFKSDNHDQFTETKWYRVKDGARVGDAIATGNTYVIKAEDVGCKIEVETAGINGYAGFVRAFSETVVKAFVSAPTGTVTKISTDSNQAKIQLPSLDAGMNSAEDKYIIGISDSENGYPVEYNDGTGVVEYAPSSNVDLMNLKPKTTYYIYLRYTTTASHYRSDWSLSKKDITTIQENFNGTISFGYTTNTDAVLGEKISAKITSTNTNFTYEGTWEWYRVLPDTTEERISNFYPEKDGDGNEVKNETYFIVPESELIGTKYRVVYIPNEHYLGTATSTSSLVKAPNKEAYDAPSKPDEVQHSDGTITVKMPSNLEGIYQFGYSLKADGSDIIEVETTALAGAEVTMSGLLRNTTYYVYSKRNGDEDKNESPWSTANLQVKTNLSNISGYVSLDEDAYYGAQLTASYNSASYVPTGDDSKGKWQWYRDNTSISGATSNTYTPVQADIGTVLKATYTANATDGFTGSKDAITETVKKAVQSNPNKVVISGMASLGSKPGINVKFHPVDTVYYRLQKASEAAPSVPLNSSEITSAKWTPSPKVTTDLFADYAGATLDANVNYILYVVKVETTTEQASSVVASDAISPSKLGVSGNVVITGDSVVGKSITATLKNSNNTTGKGTWKWYRSTQAYPSITSMPSVTDTTKWTQIPSGYYPTRDDSTSVYNVTNNDFGYYMKAEFVSDETSGYKGSVQAGNTHNKKIYDESITITSSTKDGNKNPKAYTNTVITGTINNYSETGNINRATIQFKVGSNVISTDKVTISGNTFSYKMPNNASYDGQEITAEISRPRNNGLYVDNKLVALSPGTINSKTSTSTSFTYKQGIPISNANDLESLMKQTGSYTDRSASSKYIITNNINMESKGVIAYSGNPFAGLLDGDFHTLVGMQNALFSTIQGTDANKAIIKNIVFSNAKVVAGIDVNAGIVANSVINTNLSKIIAVNSIIETYNNGGLFIGDANSSIINECGSAGGSVRKVNGVGMSIGGFIGGARKEYATTPTYENIFSINTYLHPGARNAGGVFGAISGSFTQDLNIRNIYVNTKIKVGDSLSVGMITAPKTAEPSLVNMQNVFYDKTVSPDPSFQEPSTIKDNGSPKATSEMVGVGLKSSFDTFDKSGIWTYKNGYYPQLSWVKNNFNASNIVNLYTSTRGAFTSVDGSTNSTNMFNGNISGVIQIPEDLSKSEFSVTSSDSSVLKVINKYTIVPLKAGKATITIKYTEPDSTIGGSAENTYDFTSNVGKSSFDSVTANATPSVGISDVSSILPSSAASGSSYQWYRKKVDTSDTTATSISGATSSAYTPTNADLGYQLQVKVSKSGYGTTVSNWSNPVIINAPTSAPTVTSLSDNGFVITGKGGGSSDYEYAYAESTSAEKVIVTQKGSSVTLTGLQRNKDYYVYARIAGGTGYSASAWSSSTKITTLKTNLEGSILAASSYNDGSDLRLSVPDTNLQTGTWKIERTNGSTYTDVTSLASTNSVYEIVYPLKTVDIGYYFRVTYTGNGNFQNALSLVDTNVIKSRLQNAPVEPSIVTKTDNSISVEMTSPESGTTYSFGYRTSLSDSITEVITTGSSAVLSGLERNTDYYLYARKNAKPGYEASEWSPSIVKKTNRTNLTGSITQSGNEQTEGTLVFTAPSSNQETGRWFLERFNDKGETTLDGYTVSPDGSTLTYTVVPADAGSKIRASFTGTLNFQATLSKETGSIIKKNQDKPAALPSIVSSSEYYLEAIINSGTDMYQFGYRKKGDSNAIQLFSATTAIGKSVNITDLVRNTEYEIYARKAAKIGYNAGEWTTTPTLGKTTLSPLNGNISFTGNVVVGDSVTASFNTNGYPQVGNDSNGTWSWFIDGVQQGETSRTFVIPSFAKGNPELKVMYEANTGDGFQGTAVRTIGKIGKTAFTAPDVPTVSALAEDGALGSKIQIANANVNDVYYYVQSSDVGTEPTIVLASEATTDIVTDAWVKATSNMVFNLEPNEGYQVFAARLETNTIGASAIVTGKSVRTVKEELRTSVVDQNTDITWKADQEKVLYYTQYGEAPTGIWSFYITNDLTAEWQNIDAQLYDVEQGITDQQAYVKFSLPMKFTGNYIKVVFTGTQNYTGQQEYISRTFDDVNVEGKLIGQTMKGYVEVLNPDTDELLVPIDVQYVGNDEKSGIWTWYRETFENSDIFEVIPDTTNTGVTSTYTPIASDFNRNIYAVYSANPKGLFSGKQQSNPVKQVKRSGQNKPDPVTIKEINGTRILVTPPSNFKSDLDGTRPQVVLGYKEAKDKNDANAPITWQLSANYGNNWFNNLKVNTGYVFYAKYLGTPTYELSDISDASAEAVTMNHNFVNSSYKLTKNHDNADSYIMDVGNSLTATYSDSGWDEGYFRIKRSNGDVIDEHVEAAVTKANQASCTYAYQNEDIGTHIIIEYIAKDDALYHSGSIVTATSEPVTKPIDRSIPIAPTLTSSDHTTLLLDHVNAKYEYVLTESSDVPDMNSGDWNKLPVGDAAAYEFANVTSQNAYYIHVRIAETLTSARGDKTATAGPFKVEGPIDLGSITLSNVEDEVTIPKGLSTAITVPNIVTSDTLTIKNVKMSKNGVAVSTPQTSVNEFINGDKPHENVFVKGSDWGDQHFASNLQVLDGDGNIVSSSQGDGSSLGNVTPTSSIQLEMYRVNAIKESGTYEWTCDLEDASGNVASYKAEINIETQIKAMLPIKLDMYIRDGYINQTSNNEVLRNEGMMPLNYQMDEYAQPGNISMPALLGEFNKPLTSLGKNEVYLKVSSDGSNFTTENGIWMRTSGTSQKKDLVTLGAKSKAGYLISGISDKTMNWPWDSVDNRVIQQAYLFHFLIDISTSDVLINQSIIQP